MDPKDFPAFPVLERGGDDRLEPGNPGMTLRDYFAAKALPGVLVMVALDRHDSVSFEGESQEEKLARDAYRLADAMMKARTE